MITIIQAEEEHISLLIPLLDSYRIFYKQNSNEKAVKNFLEARLQNKDSVIFIAYFNNTPAGFVQLFSSFSTVSLKPLYILNDLYVSHEYRKKGIGELLLNRAQDHCKFMGYKGLSLETATNNPAQKLYERLGWEKDTNFYHYFWKAD
ncbi:GNAT family N-acetyltransferase [uncultured Eudoraea sp.]|uniref:GNAT family N-acetyltransferase n=1 Tax=uncultured Eudoraea sp. TaxID=1035614 RepID=UPI0026252BA6|nr:GNAT family N-acetyltransferase [uncultured Eudoraea sp.]